MFSSPNLHVFGLRDETRSTRRKPTLTQGEHAPTTQKDLLSFIW